MTIFLALVAALGLSGTYAAIKTQKKRDAKKASSAALSIDGQFWYDRGYNGEPLGFAPSKDDIYHALGSSEKQRGLQRRDFRTNPPTVDDWRAAGYPPPATETGAIDPGIGTGFPPSLSLPIPPKPQETPALPAKEAAPEDLKFYWNKASIVLSGSDDPYSPTLASYANAKARFARDSSAWGQAVNSGISVMLGAFGAAVPGAGIAVAGAGLILGFFDWATKSEWYESSGGFEKLSILIKQKLFIYKLGPYKSRTGPFYSQTWEIEAPTTRPQRYRPGGIIVAQTETQDREYRDQFAKWVRRVLVSTRKDAEANRMVQSYDEVMLPPVIIVGLSKNNMWPPPLEPISRNPLDPDYVGHYLDGNYAKYYFSSLTTQHEYKNIIQNSDPPEWRKIDEEIADRVYAEIRDQYLKDAALFSQITTQVNWKFGDYIDMLPQAQTQGCVPAVGTPANPTPADRRRRL